MAIGILGGSLRHFRDLFGDGTAVGLGDGQLLARYAASRDEAAFAALVARHGPMVLATCRAILRREHDAEDAFQATFLVLAKRAGSVRAGDALGGWLHRVAYRASVELSDASRRRRRREEKAAAMATFEVAPARPDLEVAAVVHEELDRLPDPHRLPVVLCDLEGLTYEQAAARLRWTEPTLRHRLASARGRLRERLARRGITAGALAAVLAAQATESQAAVPAALMQSTIATAGGTASATAAALSATLIRGMTMTRLKIASAGVLGVLVLASAGVVAVGAGRADRPRPATQPPDAVKRRAAARTAPAGDAPVDSWIEGRIVDLEGRPVAGARVRVVNFWSDMEHGLRPWLEGAQNAGVNGPTQGLNRSPSNQAAITDADGHFRLPGFGSQHLAEVLVSGPNVATTRLFVLDRDGPEIRATNHQGLKPTTIVYHPRRFEYAIMPGRSIEGTVRDQDTGRPIAGIGLRAGIYEERSLTLAPGVEAKTNADGRYRLVGLPKAPAYRLFVDPADGQPYPKGTFRVAGDAPTPRPLTFDCAVKRGIILRGKVTDKATGRPVSGGFVNVYAFRDNPHLAEFSAFREGDPSYSPIKDGRYEVVALPGRGLIGVRAGDFPRYRGHVGAESIKGYDPQYHNFPTVPWRCNVQNYNVVVEVDLDPKAEAAERDIPLDPGRTIEVNPIDPEGRPVAETMTAGLSDLFPTTASWQKSSKIEIRGLDPSRPRRVVVFHPHRKLIGWVSLKGDETEPLTIRLQPSGTIVFRIVDEDGRPSRNHAIACAGGPSSARPDERELLPGDHVVTDIRGIRDGRLSIEGLIPGFKYGAVALEGDRIRGELFRDVTVAAGEVKDLGDLKVVPPKRGD
jgi:RNA polymerase sigma factor (sigma-70 family)